MHLEKKEKRKKGTEQGQGTLSFCFYPVDLTQDRGRTWLQPVLGVSGVFCVSTQDATSAAAIGVVIMSNNASERVSESSCIFKISLWCVSRGQVMSHPPLAVWESEWVLGSMEMKELKSVSILQLLLNPCWWFRWQ